MSDYGEMASRLRDRHDYTIAELADLRGAHDRLRGLMREASIQLAESIRLQQRALAALARALGEKPVRSVPRNAAEMAVWDAEEIEKGRIG